MDITSTTAQAVTNTSSSSSTASRANGPSADYNTFLRLLIAQAKNQDPTNPTDPSQYIQQFATLSQVEQATQGNQKLESILASIEALRGDIASLRPADSADSTGGA